MIDVPAPAEVDFEFKLVSSLARYRASALPILLDGVSRQCTPIDILGELEKCVVELSREPEVFTPKQFPVDPKRDDGGHNLPKLYLLDQLAEGRYVLCLSSHAFYSEIKTHIHDTNMVAVSVFGSARSRRYSKVSGEPPYGPVNLVSEIDQKCHQAMRIEAFEPHSNDKFTSSGYLALHLYDTHLLDGLSIDLESGLEFTPDIDENTYGNLVSSRVADLSALLDDENPFTILKGAKAGESAREKLGLEEMDAVDHQKIIYVPDAVIGIHNDFISGMLGPSYEALDGEEGFRQNYKILGHRVNVREFNRGLRKLESNRL